MRLGAFLAVIFALTIPAIANAETIAGVGSAPTVTVPATDPLRLGLARQITSLAFPEDRREAMTGAMIDTLLGQYRASFTLSGNFNDPGVNQILERLFNSVPDRLKPIVNAHLPDMFEATAGAYARRFTQAELIDILAFAKTPSGQRYLQSGGDLLSDTQVAQANTAYLAQVQQAAMAISQDARRDLNDYLAKHPDVAAKIRRGSEEQAK